MINIGKQDFINIIDIKKILGWCLFEYLIFFFDEERGSQLRRALYCSVVYIWLYVYVFLIFLFQYYVYLLCRQFCFNLKIWHFIVSSHSGDYTPGCIQISIIYLDFSFFRRAGLGWLLPPVGLYSRIDLIFRESNNALTLTIVQHLQQFVYHVSLLVVFIL